MTPQDRWTLLQTTMNSLGYHYAEQIQPAFIAAGFQPGDWFPAFMAYARDPEPITADFYNALFPYSHISRQQAQLAAAAEHGFLEKVASGDKVAANTYRATNKAREGMAQFYKSAAAAVAAVSLPDIAIGRAADLLGRAIIATETAAVPAVKSQFMLSRRSDPGAGAPPLVRLDQYITDLVRLRDDAHISAWSGLDVSAVAWEALTFIWRGQADTAAALTERLPYRGHAIATYEAALQELADKGWVKEKNGRYQITQSGINVREKIEALTDTTFFIGWAALTAEESAELDNLLPQINEVLWTQAADQAVAKRNDLWPLMGKISGHLYAITRDAVNPVLEAHDMAGRGLAFSLIQAACFDPDYVSGSRICERFPYANPENWDSRLKALAEKEYITSDGDGTYYLNDNGRTMLNQFLGAFRSEMATVADSLTVDVDRLAALLGRINDACLNSTLPGATHMQRSHALYPGEEAPALARIDQYLDNLNAFRDDAHLASFRDDAISGHGWEIFTMIWREQVTNAAEMAEKAGRFRGHDVASYQIALDDLVARGWLTTSDDGYTVTDSGRQVRATADTMTDRYFYLPWFTVQSQETEELRQLLTELEAEMEKATAQLA